MDFSLIESAVNPEYTRITLADSRDRQCERAICGQVSFGPRTVSQLPPGARMALAARPSMVVTMLAKGAMIVRIIGGHFSFIVFFGGGGVCWRISRILQKKHA